MVIWICFNFSTHLTAAAPTAVQGVPKKTISESLHKYLTEHMSFITEQHKNAPNTKYFQT